MLLALFSWFPNIVM